MQSDFRDAMQDMEKEQYREQMDFKRDEAIKRLMSQANDIDRQKLQTQRDIAATNLEIAKKIRTSMMFKSSKKKDKDTE